MLKTPRTRIALILIFFLTLFGTCYHSSASVTQNVNQNNNSDRNTFTQTNTQNIIENQYIYYPDGSSAGKISHEDGSALLPIQHRYDTIGYVRIKNPEGARGVYVREANGSNELGVVMPGEIYDCVSANTRPNGDKAYRILINNDTIAVISSNYADYFAGIQSDQTLSYIRGYYQNPDSDVLMKAEGRRNPAMQLKKGERIPILGEQGNSYIVLYYEESLPKTWHIEK